MKYKLDDDDDDDLVSLLFTNDHSPQLLSGVVLAVAYVLHNTLFFPNKLKPGTK